MKFKAYLGGAITGLLLSACGGGGDGAGLAGVEVQPSALSAWQQGVYPNSSVFKARCALPRSGTDAFGRSFADRQGTAQDEKMWLRSWSDELYLWYDEIADRDPSSFSVSAYFDLLKTTETTNTGRPKDNFHFTENTAEYLQLSQSGVSSGYGMRLAVDNSQPRTVTVVYTEPNSPAADAGLSRGAQVIRVDGVDIQSNSMADLAVLNAGLFPGAAGERHRFVFLNVGESLNQTVELISADVVTEPVQNVETFDVAGRTVGYFLFNRHIATAEAALVDAVQTLSTANIDELVLDLRYNGGGFLTIASQLSYMVAGPTASNGRSFETLQFNDKHPTLNPVTNEPIVPLGFVSETAGFSLSSGQTLPSLDLSRVFIISGAATCSASEAIINGLRGIDIEVIQIGKSTCGKPYGFYATDNCGTTYFSIQFQGVNDKGFGEYPDGFSPTDSADGFGVELPGCDVDDDLQHPLGDRNEARLATALHYIEHGTCVSAASKPSLRPNFEKTGASGAELELLGVREWEKSRIMGGAR